jgi:O-antigen/teichoic acid export membrane protein
MSEAKMGKPNKYQDLFDTRSLVTGLKKRSLRGGLFTMAGSGIGFVLRLGATAVLARLLVPEHFGLISMVTALTAIAESFKDFGLSTATIQQKEITHEQVSTLFWINALIGLVIMAIICGLAVFIARFYGDARLTWITIALSTSFFWGGCTVQHQALLLRKMKFAALTSINLGATVLSILVAIVLALKGYGFWALVWREISRSGFFAIGTWLCCPWLPGWPSRNAGVGGMLKMGGDITAFNLITFFTDNLDYILVGKVFGAGSLGYYKQGTQLAMLPIGFLTEPVNTVAQPALRTLQDDLPRYRAYYKKILGSLTFATMPLMVFLFVHAHELIRALLGEKWDGAVVYFQIFAAAGFIRPAIGTTGFVMITSGITRRYLFLGLINSLSIVVGICVGFMWGAVGVAMGHMLANYVLFLPAAYIAFKGTPVSVGLFLSSIVPSLICSLGMGLALTLFASLYPIQNNLFAVIAAAPIGAVSYLALWMLMPEGKARLTGMFMDFTSTFRASA